MDENGNNTLKNISAVLSEKGYKVRPVREGRYAADKSLDSEYDLVLANVNVLRDRGVESLDIMPGRDSGADLLLISTQADKRQKTVEDESHAKKIDSDRLRSIIKQIDFEMIRREREKSTDIEEQADYEEYLWIKRVFNAHRRAKFLRKLRENIVLIILCIFTGAFAVLIGTNMHKIVPGGNYLSEQVDRLITAVERDWGR